MKDTIKRWSIYITIFVVSMLLTDQYREYRQLQEFEAVRKDLIRQEQEAVKDQERKCLVNALYYEARGESLQGILAVASVIDSRKSDSKYPNTYCGVINQKGQFSYTLLNKPDIEQFKYRFKPIDAIVYKNIEYIANEMVNGEFKPVLDQSVQFYATKKIKNYWTKTKQVVAKIGNHVFYKDK
jgi:spore germination cell wall hydrolase CwlJ-like protein